MIVPDSTYRLQLSAGFPFSEAEKMVGYLKSLGVSDLYCSPVLKAVHGSIHCYDVVDHSIVNPELGGEEGLRRLAIALRKAGMGLLLDIVPNHMSASTENGYWMDVLEYGRASPFASMFDIDWRPATPGLTGKVLLPVLDRPPLKAVQDGTVRLALGSEKDGRFVVVVGAHEYPMSPRSYPRMVSLMKSATRTKQEEVSLRGLQELLPRPWPEIPAGNRSFSECVKKLIGGKLREDPHLMALAKRAVTGEAGLRQVLDEQNYVLAHWKEADTKINYRRFLNVNELVAVRVEERAVFEKTHRVVLELLRSGRATGLRVDHADGLRDPALYFRWLKSALGRGGGPKDLYVLAEKIVQTGKRLPPEWDVSGTTGYVFMNELNRLFVKSENAERLDSAYRRFSGEVATYEESVYEGKLLAIKTMQAELGTLARLLSKVYPRESIEGDLKDAVKEVAANFEGYRVYISPRSRSVRGPWRRRIARAVSESRQKGANRRSLKAIEDALLLRERGSLKGESRRDLLEFVLRFQQFTVAIAVKGEEDTALYRYNRLTSLNEVGGDPRAFGAPLSEFHRRCRERLRAWPHSMVSTSTHDTKRSEDVRARINVLSEIPDLWEAALKRWSHLNTRARSMAGGRAAPTKNDEYLFYQTILGAWPQSPTDRHANFVDRIVCYMRKASKEERRETSWTRPDPRYDAGVERFVRAALRNGSGNRFLDDFAEFERKINWFGMLNSLSQTLLKFTSPGVPDTYQGQELWDYSLVDPDNRRPVDFAVAKAALAKLDRTFTERGALVAARESLEDHASGMTKLYVTSRVLRYRSENRELFRDGDYVPLKAAGPKRHNLCSFARETVDRRCLVCAPRFFTELCEGGTLPLGSDSWGETQLLLPRGCTGPFVNVLTGRRLVPDAGKDVSSLPAAKVFEDFPVALFRSD